jgi:hypothetical protein
LGAAAKADEDSDASPDTVRSLLALTSRMRTACDEIERSVKKVDERALVEAIIDVPGKLTHVGEPAT